MQKKLDDPTHMAFLRYSQLCSFPGGQLVVAHATPGNLSRLRPMEIADTFWKKLGVLCRLKSLKFGKNLMVTNILFTLEGNKKFQMLSVSATVSSKICLFWVHLVTVINFYKFLFACHSFFKNKTTANSVGFW